MSDHYTNYYMLQSGKGLSDIGAVYHQQQVIQHGRGLGAFFGGLARYLKPFFMHGLNVIKQEAMNTGVEILSEIGTRPINDILREKSKTAVQNLQDKAINHIRSNMNGSGISTGINRFKKHKYGSLTDVNSFAPKLLKAKKNTKQTKKKKTATIKKNIKKKVTKTKKKSVDQRSLDIFS